MLFEDQHPNNKQITVAVLGAPNVGKSSLINYLLGMDLSVVTHKAQTTRNKFQCVFTIDHTEVVLVDTPGIHRSNQEFNKRLNQQAREGAEGVDLNLLLIDLSKDILAQFKDFKEVFEEELTKTWVIFTKADTIKNVEKLPLDEVIETVKPMFPHIERYLYVSAKSELNMNILTGALCDVAEPGKHFYPDGSISNKNERFFVTEYIREQAFELLKDEIPYEVAVVIDEYKDMKAKDENAKLASHISASILVNRPGQRAIVIGSKGKMIKEIGIRSRRKIEKLVGGQVHLNLHVKVAPKWFNNNFILEEIGLPRAHNSNRVWRNS